MLRNKSNTSTSLAAGEDVVIWNCSVTAHGGGGGPPPNDPFGNPGSGTGLGGGLGGSGGGGSSGPIPNEQYDDGSGNGYGGYPPSSSPSATTTIIVSANLLPCVKSALSSLQNMNGNDIGNLYQFFSATPNTDWIIQTGTIPPDTQGRQINALTSQSNGMPANYLATTLNTSFTNTATDVAITRTLIHESLHAYLLRWTYNQGMNVNLTTSQLADAYLAKMYLYSPATSSNVAQQHAAMTAIINQMATSLQAAFPNLNLSDDYAGNLFWAGLTETDAYAALPTAQKSAITAASTAEILSTPAAKGTKACN